MVAAVKQNEQHRFFAEYFDELGARLRDGSVQDLATLCRTFMDARDRGRKVIIAGNGASAAIASHVSVDLTKTCEIRAVNFNEADLITCFANDFGYEQWLAKAVELYGDSDDVAVFVSSSGKSPNVIRAAARARECGLRVVTLSGFDADNPLRSLGELNLWVNSHSYNVVETTHQSWLLAAIDNIVGMQATSKRA
jgi:D-sedoheptulose 7-phosphate isomerase